MVRGIHFNWGQSSWGGGICTGYSAIVTMELCLFTYYRGYHSGYGGGTIYPRSESFQVYATSFPSIPHKMVMVTIFTPTM